MARALYLPAAVLRAIRSHACDAAPDECVGVLFGHGERVVRSVVLPNRAATPRTRFFADPQGLFDALEGADARGETLLAVYHSHPQGAAFPSATDIAAAQGSPLHLIVTPEAVRAFRISGADVAEVTLECGTLTR